MKSWNAPEASGGMAAINAWYKTPDALKSFTPHPNAREHDAFAVYAQDIVDKRVAVVGHFPGVENRLSQAGELTVLERKPWQGDYPDPACEYVLGNQDYVFITGSTFANRTAPRILQLAENAWVVIMGPTTPLAAVLFEEGVDGLSGLVVSDPQKLKKSLRGVGGLSHFDAGVTYDVVKPR